MDWHDYVAGKLIATQLDERRAHAARAHLARALRAPRPRLRAAVGLVLIRLGSHIVGPHDARLSGTGRSTAG
jgi:hypothetical protein